MTGYLVLRQSTVDGLGPLRRRMLDSVMRDVRLAEQPSTIQKAGVVAYCYGSTSWDEDGIAILGALWKNAGVVTEAVRSDMDDPHGAKLRAWMHGFLCGAGLIVQPEDIPAVADNRMQEILTAQGAPLTHIRFYTGHPIDVDGWAVYPTPAPEDGV